MSIRIERTHPITSEFILAKELMRYGQLTLNCTKSLHQELKHHQNFTDKKFLKLPSQSITIISFLYQIVTGRVGVRSQLCAVSSLCSGVSAGKVGNNTEVTI